MGLFDRFKGVTDIVKFLVKVKPEDIARVVEAGTVLADGKWQLEADLDAALVIADVVTDYTPGEFDDQAVDAIKQLVAQESTQVLFDMLESLFKDNKPKNLEAMRYAYEKQPAAGIPWPVLVQVAVFLYNLIKDFKKGDE